MGFPPKIINKLMDFGLLLFSRDRIPTWDAPPLSHLLAVRGFICPPETKFLPARPR